MLDNINNDKYLWELDNRSKGRVSTKIEEITKNPDYCEDAMGEFYRERSKLVYSDKFAHPNLDIDPDFPVYDTLPEYNIDIKH